MRPGNLLGLAAVVPLLAATPALALDDPTPVAGSTPVQDRTINTGVPHLLNNPVFISFRVTDADVKSVLQYLAAKGGMNLMLDDSVTGKVSLNLKAVPTDEALALVLKIRNLRAQRVGSSLLIASDSVFSKKNLGNESTIALRVNNAVASDLINQIRQVVPSDTKVLADARTNSIIIMGTDEVLAKARAMVKALDIPAPEVLIECKMVEVSESINDNLSFAYGLTGGKTVSTFAGTTGGTTNVTFDPLQNLSGAFNAQLQALISTGKATVLANPKVLAQDSAQATIKLVNRLPYITFQFTSTGQQIPQVSFVDVGQTLQIKPRIDSNGFVTMEMMPDITVQAPNLPGIAVPVVNDRSVSTTLRVKDGESIVIGGLKRREENGLESKVPILGDIPILGALFKGRTNTTNTSEIVIVVTPHIVSKLYGDVEGLPALNGGNP